MPPKRDGRKRVLFLLSDTGGGHKASAKAIQMALDQLYPGQVSPPPRAPAPPRPRARRPARRGGR